MTAYEEVETGVAMSTRPGDLLADRYRLIDLLSESGGGRFWRAHDQVLERYVALHVLAAADPRAPELLAAARDSARVQDHRVLRVLDAATIGDLCYVVNEWGTGTSLDILTLHAGPLGPRRSAWLVAEVAGAITTAHDAGVGHGRLNPENVLIDRFGAVKLIGLGVDAALHGLPRGRYADDRADLAGLLYCALTATWPGPSGSAVEPAPRDHDVVMSPRRVRAGVPRPLDDIWRAVSEQHHRRRRQGTHAGPDVTSAAALRERLLEFIGDTAAMPQALASSIPPINEIRPVDLPAVPDPVVRTEPRPIGPVSPPDRATPPDLATPPDPATPPDLALPASQDTRVTQVVDAAPAGCADDTSPLGTTSHEATGHLGTTGHLDDADAQMPDGVSITDLPTEAGTPIFGEDDVEWMTARRTPPPPPPPFEPPPERPLFAPDPVRRPRADVTHPAPASFGPTLSGPAPPPPHSLWEADATDTAESPAVPGRNWLRLAMVLSAAVLLLVAIVVAFNLGRGRTPLGAERDPSEPASSTPPTLAGTKLTDLTATDFDPAGGEEHPEQAPLAVDGDPSTAWSTDTYFDPLALIKPGVGLVIDLGATYKVTDVELTLTGAPYDVELHLGAGPPTVAPATEPFVSTTGAGDIARLEAKEPVPGRYLLVWFTSLPEVSGDWRGGLAEVVVRGT